MRGPRQLTLELPRAMSVSLDVFEELADGEVVARLRGLTGESDFACIWINAPTRHGKSHLLQGACERASDAGLRTAYLPAQMAAAGEVAFDGLDDVEVAAVDDLEAWLGDGATERALVGFFESLKARGGKLLLASIVPPASAVFHLADLGSRLRAAACYALRPRDDQARARVLMAVAARRGVHLSPDVATYLLRRETRDLGSLLDTLAHIETESAVEQRRITVPFVKSVLDP